MKKLEIFLKTMIILLGIILVTSVIVVKISANDSERIRLEAQIRWDVGTNWVQSEGTLTTLMIGNNTITYFEDGWVYSNIVATIVWKGQKKTLILEENLIGTLKRSYTLETVRKYK